MTDVAGKLMASTAGASSPISIPVTGSPVVSGSNPVTTSSFGNFLVGGAKNDAADGFGTPARAFGLEGVGGFLSSSSGLILLAAGAAAFMILRR